MLPIGSVSTRWISSSRECTVVIASMVPEVCSALSDRSLSKRVSVHCISDCSPRYSGHSSPVASCSCATRRRSSTCWEVIRKSGRRQMNSFKVMFAALPIDAISVGCLLRFTAQQLCDWKTSSTCIPPFSSHQQAEVDCRLCLFRLGCSTLTSSVVSRVLRCDRFSAELSDCDNQSSIELRIFLFI